MDEDSILFQAMRDEMSPAYQGFNPVAQRRDISPFEPYPIGVEVRNRSPGGTLANPLRMQQQPSDFAGRPAHANQNPTYYGLPAVQRPAGNVINQFQKPWQDERMINAIERAKNAPPVAESPGMARRVLQYMREMFNANRSPDWWKNF